MRRLALVASLIIVLGLTFAAPALARTAKEQPSTMTTTNRAMVSKEPAGVFGWAVVKDPSTGKRWTPDTYPSVTVYFVNRKNGRQEWINFGDGSVAKLESRYNTWRYYIKFVHDTGFNNKPTPDGPRDTVKYNPNDYRFSHLKVYFRKFERSGGSTRTTWQVDCSKQSRPFGDLPDIAEPTWR